MASFGVIFDADGVLLDSEEQSFVALCDAVEELTDGKIRILPDQVALVTGRDDVAVLDLLRELHGVRIDPTDLRECKLDCYRRAIARKPLALKEGVLALLEELDRDGVPYAVATSAIRDKLEISLKALGLENRFPITTTADDVVAGKPDPALFVLSARRLDIEPRRIVVFEDSLNGIEAANAAGMFSVGVVGTFSREHLTHARALIEGLHDVSITFLRQWLDDSSQ